MKSLNEMQTPSRTSACGYSIAARIWLRAASAGIRHTNTTHTHAHTHRSCPFSPRAVFSPNGMPALRCLARPLRYTRRMRIRTKTISAFSRRWHEILIGSHLRLSFARRNAVPRARTRALAPSILNGTDAHRWDAVWRSNQPTGGSNGCAPFR